MNKILNALVIYSLFAGTAYAVGSGGSLSTDEVAVANSVVGSIGSEADDFGELLFKNKSQIAAVLKSAGIKGSVKIESGSLSGGGTPLYQNTYYNLNIQQCTDSESAITCKNLGALTIALSVSKASDHPSRSTSITYKKSE